MTPDPGLLPGDETTKRNWVAETFASLRNPVHAALLAAAYLIWFLTAQVTASQQANRDQLQKHMEVTEAMVQEMKAQQLDRSAQTALLRRICIGVAKASERERCADR